MTVPRLAAVQHRTLAQIPSAAHAPHATAAQVVPLACVRVLHQPAEWRGRHAAAHASAAHASAALPMRRPSLHVRPLGEGGLESRRRPVERLAGRRRRRHLSTSHPAPQLLQSAAQQPRCRRAAAPVRPAGRARVARRPAETAPRRPPPSAPPPPRCSLPGAPQPPPQRRHSGATLECAAQRARSPPLLPRHWCTRRGAAPRRAAPARPRSRPRQPHPRPLPPPPPPPLTAWAVPPRRPFRRGDPCRPYRRPLWEAAAARIAPRRPPPPAPPSAAGAARRRRQAETQRRSGGRGLPPPPSRCRERRRSGRSDARSGSYQPTVSRVTGRLAEGAARRGGVRALGCSGPRPCRAPRPCRLCCRGWCDAAAAPRA